MAKSEKNIQLDLNNPVFQDSWFALESVEAERVRRSFEKIRQLTWPDFYRAKGFKWEKIVSISAPDGVDAVYTFRVTDSVRGVAYREDHFLRVLYIQPDHDATYGKK